MMERSHPQTVSVDYGLFINFLRAIFDCSELSASKYAEHNSCDALADIIKSVNNAVLYLGSLSGPLILPSNFTQLIKAFIIGSEWPFQIIVTTFY
ncbi:hypothetical protein GSU75_00463 [Pseudomonas savastanoi pv. phaseolicola]|nr:hypothetical protein [Pseudomonas savastanoi pv. phaseolicola]MBN4179785.1 hypothetical protein [Pseudomonas savastanoi pv. phaseolicola]RMV61378.1 hypothetical protein ALP07_01289 [Pseudomonas savastanoi pv. glycinea]